MSLLEWQHTDDRGLTDAIAASLVRAQAWAWDSSADSVADFRALLIATACVGASLTHQDLTASPLSIDATPLDTSAPVDSSESARAAQQLGKNLATLGEYSMRVGGVPGSFAFHFETSGGGAPVDTADPWQPPGEAGNPLIVPIVVAGAVVYIVVAAIGAAAICYLAHESLPVLERTLQQSEETKRLAADHATALAVLQVHASREKAAGTPLSLDAGEKDVLRMVEDSRQQVEERMKTILKNSEPKGFFESLFSQPIVVVGAFAAGAALTYKLTK